MICIGIKTLGRDTSVTDGKEVVLAVVDSEEREAVSTLLEDLHMIVHHADSGQDAIFLLEDYDCDFLVMDVQLSDMHAWKMISRLKEIVDVTTLPTIVIMDEKTSFPLSNVTSVVRPVSMAKLKHIIYNLFSA
jgi:response regulator RpfG family c-di-GMP phosphodiesterase